jgi:hypothetical protein
MPTIDFPPWLQTTLTLLAVLLVALHQAGRVMVRRDPMSVWGARLVLLGIGLQALRRSPASAALPPMARAVLHSLTDSERPGDPEATPVTRDRSGER